MYVSLILLSLYSRLNVSWYQRWIFRSVSYNTYPTKYYYIKQLSLLYQVLKSIPKWNLGVLRLDKWAKMYFRVHTIGNSPKVCCFPWFFKYLHHVHHGFLFVLARILKHTFIEFRQSAQTYSKMPPVLGTGMVGRK